MPDDEDDQQTTDDQSPTQTAESDQETSQDQVTDESAGQTTDDQSATQASESDQETSQDQVTDESGAQTADDQGGDQQTTDDQSQDQQTADDQGASQQTTDDQSQDQQPSDDQSGGQESAEEQSQDQQTTEDQDSRQTTQSAAGGTEQSFVDTRATKPQRAGTAPTQQQSSAPQTTSSTQRPPPPAPLQAGEKQPDWHRITRTQLYNELTRLAPDLGHDFKTLLVGQSWVEQSGNIPNWNVGGIEGSHAAFVKIRTSTTVSRAAYEANPTAYDDWKVGPADQNTIQKQLDAGKTTLFVVGPAAPRPAYGSLAEGAYAFLSAVESRLNMLKSSTDSTQVALANNVLAGDVDAYVTALSTRFTVTDANGKTSTILPYNAYYATPAKKKAITDAVTAAKQELASLS